MNEIFTRYDTADYLKTEEDIAAYLEASAAFGDPQTIETALAVVARARAAKARSA